MTLSIAKLERNETPTRNRDRIVFATAIVESGFTQGPLNRRGYGKEDKLRR